MEKREYMEKIEAQLIEYNAKLAELRGTVLQAQTDMRREYLSQVRMLESKQDELRKTYEQLKEVSSNAWEDAKEVTEKALADFKVAFDKAINHIKL